MDPPHMVKQKQDDQLEFTYSSYMKTQNVTLKTCRRRWMIGRGGERGSGISVLAARHEDDDIYIYMYISSSSCRAASTDIYLSIYIYIYSCIYLSSVHIYMSVYFHIYYLFIISRSIFISISLNFIQFNSILFFNFISLFHLLSTFHGSFFPSQYLSFFCSLWFCFISFYGISTIVGYVMPNPFYIRKHFIPKNSD